MVEYLDNENSKNGLVATFITKTFKKFLPHFGFHAAPHFDIFYSIIAPKDK